MSKILLFAATFQLLAVSCTIAQAPAYNPAYRLGKQQLQADFEVLHEVITGYHPAPYTYIDKDHLDALKGTLLESIPDSLTEREFHLIVRSYLAELKCGHTVAKPTAEWYNYIRSGNKLIPFDLYLTGAKAFVKNVWVENQRLAPGDEVMEINGKTTEQLLKEMRSIQQRDGFTQTFVDYSIQENFRTYYAFLYGAQPAFALKIKNREGIPDTVLLPAVKPAKAIKPAKQYPPEMKEKLKNDWACLRIDTIRNIAYLDIDGFGNRNYKKFYKNAFSIIARSETDILIIDLRDNGGGYFPNGNKFLTYLTNEKFRFRFYRPAHKIKKNPNVKMGFYSQLTKAAFTLIPNKNRVKGRKSYQIAYKPARNRFEGKIHVITNGGSFSMSSYVAAYLKNNTSAVFYGSETGGSENGSNALLTNKLILPNSKIEVFVPYYHFDHAFNKADFGYGVKPHIEIDTPVGKAASEADSILLKVVELAQESQ